MEKPIWLLDVDGVINVIQRQFPRTFPEDTWQKKPVTTTGDNERGIAITVPIRWSTVVTDFITEMSELVEIRWLTTWGNDANHLASEIGLPQFAVQPAVDTSLTPGEPRPKQTLHYWWKMHSGIAVAQEGRPIIWTDDDLTHVQKTLFKTYVPDGLDTLLITTYEDVGLKPKHLEAIRGFAQKHAGQ